MSSYVNLISVECLQHMRHLRELTKSEMRAFCLETWTLNEMISVILFLVFHICLKNYFFCFVFFKSVQQWVVSPVSAMNLYSLNPLNGSALLGEG